MLSLTRAPMRLRASAGQKFVRPAVVARVAQPKASVQPAVAEAQEQNAAPAWTLAMASAAMPFLFDVSAAMAKDGEYGLLEGRSVALLHPLIMGVLFFGTLYAGYLGYQWRRARELGDEIRELKRQLPAPAADGTAVASPLTATIEGKEKERKELLAGNYRDKHWWWGSLLLSSGVGIAIEGCANTYIRTGKLFPGPHLYAGAGIVALWAMAAALVPAMQKGDNNARNAHIALNALNLALFAWQVPTGLEIVGKVFQFTQWP